MCYAIALGSNQRHQRYGPPHDVLNAALLELDRKPLRLVARAKAIHSTPIGPSRRRYSNAAAIVETKLSPAKLLKRLKKIERAFGRRDGGQRWRDRVLDLDIILWSGGIWATSTLSVPHPAFRTRRFVLAPLVSICPAWRDPVSGLLVRHLYARLDRRRVST